MANSQAPPAREVDPLARLPTTDEQQLPSYDSVYGAHETNNTSGYSEKRRGPQYIEMVDIDLNSQTNVAVSDSEELPPQTLQESPNRRASLGYVDENQRNAHSLNLTGTNWRSNTQADARFPTGNATVTSTSFPLILPDPRNTHFQDNTDIIRDYMAPVYNPEMSIAPVEDNTDLCDDDYIAPVYKSVTRPKSNTLPTIGAGYTSQREFHLQTPITGGIKKSVREKTAKRIAEFISWLGEAEEEKTDPVGSAVRQLPADVILDMDDDLEEYRVQLLRENTRNPEGPVLRRESLIDRGFQPEEPTARYRQRNLYGCLMRTMEEMLRLKTTIAEYSLKTEYVQDQKMALHVQNCANAATHLDQLLHTYDDLERSQSPLKQVKLRDLMGFLEGGGVMEINMCSSNPHTLSKFMDQLASDIEAAVQQAKAQLSLDLPPLHGVPRPHMKLIRRLGGSFPSDGVYWASVDGKYEVVKVKYSTENPNVLTHEYAIYSALRNAEFRCIPKVQGYIIGRDNLHGLRIKRLGLSLADIRKYRMGGEGFGDTTICMLAIQGISRLMDLHSLPQVPGSPDGDPTGFFVHRNITPRNLVMGSGKHENSLFLIDYARATRFKRGQKVREARRSSLWSENSPSLGDTVYTSIADLRGEKLHPRDDLESLGYTLMDLSASVNYRTWPKEHEEDPQKMLTEKLSIRVQSYYDLLKEFPALGRMMNMVRLLPLGSLPVGYYKEIINGFQEELAILGTQQVYDWLLPSE